MVNSVHTSHQLRTSQRGGGFSFAGKWSLAHPSGRYGILVRSCILTRSSPIAGGAGWYPAGLRLVACACAVLLLSPLLCFYFASTLLSTLPSTLPSTLLPTFLNLIPNLIFESTNLILKLIL